VCRLKASRPCANEKSQVEVKEMSQAEQKIVQYLNEAHGIEQGLVRVLQAQIAMTPHGRHRNGLEAHLEQTRGHAKRLRARLEELGVGGNPLQLGAGLVLSAIGQALALGKAPLDLLRGSGGEEKVLKNAKDACAAEALEIATYAALEALAESLGDTETQRLAASIRADEEQMLERLLAEIPTLTESVVDAEIRDRPSYDIAQTGAADTVRAVGESIKDTAGKARAEARRGARQARKVPGVAQLEGELRGVVASEEDLAIPGYGALTAADVVERLPGLSQMELAKIDSYERRHENRSTILSRVTSLRGQEPWPGYDELTVSEIRSAIGTDEERVKRVRAYERSHKNRAGVIGATERDASHA
jgi:ferritin-like metal-binding protein YciE